MTMASPKGLRPRSSIVVTVGGLATFLIVASLILISYPIRSSLQGYVQEESLDKGRQVPSVVSVNRDHSNSRFVVSKQDDGSREHSSGSEEMGGTSKVKEDTVIREFSSGSEESKEKKEVEASDGSVSQVRNEVAEIDKNLSSNLMNVSESDGLEVHDDNNSNGKKEEAIMIDQSPSPGVKNNSENGSSDAKVVAPEVDRGSASGTEQFTNGKEKVGISEGLLSQNSTEVVGIDDNGSGKASSEADNVQVSGSDGATPFPSPPSDSKIETREAGPQSCDLYRGKWIYDPTGPLYTNNSCPVITQMQNCQGNGRPDKNYENYRWGPHQCNLPRFNPRKFLELMRGKTIAYIGDSVARNQMESMLCILWQEEVPKNRGNRRMQRWFFRSTSTMIVRIWSSWLVHTDSEPFQFAPKGITKVFLDIPDKTFMDFLLTFDVVVLSSGHWFAKQSAYVLNNNIVGGQLWWPKDAGPMRVNNAEAFGISVETIMTSIANHPNFTGLTILRSYSPDHYEGGAWNTGGSCTGKDKPLGEVVRNGFTDFMHDKQIKGFERAVDKSKNGGGHAKLRLMDITEAFGYRADGHPGPYRSPDPNKKTKRGPHGEPPPQDCLHWCMPGPVDTWNEILLEVIRREFEGE